MKITIIIGGLLAAAGLYVLLNGASISHDKTVLKAGPLEANVEKRESVPPWAGGVALVVGIGLIAVGFKKP